MQFRARTLSLLRHPGCVLLRAMDLYLHSEGIAIAHPSSEV